MFTEKDLKKTTGDLNNSNQIAYPKPYDERQMAIRGKAYRYGFISMIAYYALLMMLHDLAIKFAEINLWIFIGLVIGGMAFVTYSIFHDAYFGLGANDRMALISFALAAPAGIVVGIRKIGKGLAFENGLLSIEIMPMILGVFFLYICIMVGIKKMLDREGDHDEKSETESGSGAS